MDGNRSCTTGTRHQRFDGMCVPTSPSAESPTSSKHHPNQVILHVPIGYSSVKIRAVMDPFVRVSYRGRLRGEASRHLPPGRELLTIASLRTGLEARLADFSTHSTPMVWWLCTLYSAAATQDERTVLRAGVDGEHRRTQQRCDHPSCSISGSQSTKRHRSTDTREDLASLPRDCLGKYCHQLRDSGIGGGGGAVPPLGFNFRQQPWAPPTERQSQIEGDDNAIHLHVARRMKNPNIQHPAACVRVPLFLTSAHLISEGGRMTSCSFSVAGGATVAFNGPTSPRSARMVGAACFLHQQQDRHPGWVKGVSMCRSMEQDNRGTCARLLVHGGVSRHSVSRWIFRSQQRLGKHWWRRCYIVNVPMVDAKLCLRGAHSLQEGRTNARHLLACRIDRIREQCGHQQRTRFCPHHADACNQSTMTLTSRRPR